MEKSADAFRTISEVADWLGLQTHVLRFWESKFTHVKPVKRAGGRRYYRPVDMLLLGGIKKLLHEDGLTIKGVQKILREKGVSYVSNLSQPIEGVEISPPTQVSYHSPQSNESLPLDDEKPAEQSAEVAAQTSADEPEDTENTPVSEPAAQAPALEPQLDLSLSLNAEAETLDEAPEPQEPASRTNDASAQIEFATNENSNIPAETPVSPVARAPRDITNASKAAILSAIDKSPQLSTQNLEKIAPLFIRLQNLQDRMSLASKA